MDSTINTSEAHILEHIVMPDHPGLSPESARAILELRFDPPALSRMNELAERNRQGALTEADSEEMGNYLRVGNLLNLLQAKARLSLVSRN